MKATRRGHSTQVDRIKWAFKEFLDEKLSPATEAATVRMKAV